MKSKFKVGDYVNFEELTGEIVEVNAELEDAPELVNNDPYGKGWMIKIAIKDASELDKLMDAAGYEAYRG